MHHFERLAHAVWECKYHVLWRPKYRKGVLYGRLRRGIGEMLRQLCRQKGIGLQEGKAMAAHMHMLLSVAPEIQHSDDNWIPES